MHQPLFKILMTESEHPQLWSSLCDHCVSTETGSSGPSAGLRSTPQLSQSVSICRQTMTSSSSSLFRWITWAPDVSLWTLLSSRVKLKSDPIKREGPRVSQVTQADARLHRHGYRPVPSRVTLKYLWLNSSISGWNNSTGFTKPAFG